MLKILLFTDDEMVFRKTKEIVNEEFELIWLRFNDINRQEYFCANIVIIHFSRTRIIEGTFLPIINVKGKMGTDIPILVIMDGTPQEIFSVLKAGAYDYITTIEDQQMYEKKKKDIFLWEWYRNKYKSKK